MMRSNGILLVGVAVGLAIGACTTGVIDGDAPGGPGAVEGSPHATVLGRTPMRRLGSIELTNTLRDLLVEPELVIPDLPPDPVGAHGFPSPGIVSDLEVERAMDLAEAVSPKIVAKLASLAACGAASDDATCTRSFVRDFGRRAYRRPLEAEERARLEALYTHARSALGHDHARAIELVAQAMLQSPSFLYRPETTLEGSGAQAAAPVSQHELASRLSYFLWSSMPDDALLDAADAGALVGDEIERQARRMLADRRAERTIAAFHAAWLGLDRLEGAVRSESLYPGFDDALVAAMRVETERFTARVLLEGDGKLSTLLTAPIGFVDRKLAAVYGVEPPAAGAAFVDLDPKSRAGLLTQASVLTATSSELAGSPIHRGLLVRERFLCDPLPPPPVDVPPPPVIDPSAPIRDQWERHSSDPACRGCHRRIDPIGFAFEGYDAVGAYQAVRNGKTVDQSGELRDTLDADGAFTGPVELAHRLAGSEQVRRCVTTQWLRFATGRLEHRDATSIDAAHARFASSAYDVRELLIAIVQTPAFLLRGEASR